MQDFKKLDDEFAGAFRLARDEAGLSQEAVAERMRGFGFDVSQPVIGKIERGQRRVSIGEAKALSACVSKSLSSLLLGPQNFVMERATQGLNQLRSSLKSAVNNFQSGQEMLAMVADSEAQKDELSPYFLDDLEHTIFEPVAEVLLELERDNEASNEAQRFRDGLDPLGEGESHEMQTGRFGDYLARYYEACGPGVDHFVNAAASAAIFGAPVAPPDLDAELV